MTEGITANAYFLGLLAGIHYNLGHTLQYQMYADYLANIQNGDGTI